MAASLLAGRDLRSACGEPPVTSLRVALACQEAAGLQTLRRVVDRGHRVVAVFTDPTREPSGAPGVAGAAGELGLDVRDARLVRDPGLGDWLRDERVDVLLNVHSLYLVAEAVVEAPRSGASTSTPARCPGSPGSTLPAGPSTSAGRASAAPCTG